MQPYAQRKTLTLANAIALANEVFGTTHDARKIAPRMRDRSDRTTREVIVVRKRFGRDHVSRILVTK